MTVIEIDFDCSDFSYFDISVQLSNSDITSEISETGDEIADSIGTLNNGQAPILETQETFETPDSTFMDTIWTPDSDQLPVFETEENSFGINSSAVNNSPNLDSATNTDLNSQLYNSSSLEEKQLGSPFTKYDLPVA